MLFILQPFCRAQYLIYIVKFYFRYVTSVLLSNLFSNFLFIPFKTID